MVDSVYMVYIPVYSVYAKYRGVPVSIVLYMVYMPYTQGYMSVSSCIWCIYLYIVYMPYTGETSQCGGQCVCGVYTCI